MPLATTLSPAGRDPAPGPSVRDGGPGSGPAVADLDRLIERLRRDIAELERRWI